MVYEFQQLRRLAPLHMTTVLAIPLPTATAIPRNVEDNVYASIHNPRIVDNNILISKIEDRFMALLSQSFNERFAKRHAHSENDLLDNLTVHCYDIDIHEKRHGRQLNNTLLVDFVELNLHSTEGNDCDSSPDAFHRPGRAGV